MVIKTATPSQIAELMGSMASDAEGAAMRELLLDAGFDNTDNVTEKQWSYFIAAAIVAADRPRGDAMKWEIAWGGEIVFGEDFGGILADALEIFTETITTGNDLSGFWCEWLPADLGHHCDRCGRYAMTRTVEYNDVATTDHGDEERLIAYELCNECRTEF